ncbi:hypothetical protein OM949_12905 [Xanthomonas phaseoli pv. phaseoli]|nr:hypothetical protein [Xanthomonas phaseoli]UZB14984.1 hypothetical protein OM949_12905 [Xanthomonas phaseoli pv. phaseoli]UZB19147.1 hypothetical protein OM947_13080 [Xanthomonas phaseoli pv. phaseoli]
MSRRDLHKALRVAPGVYLLLQIRATDVLAELYADSLHDRPPVMFACSAIEKASELFLVDDGTGWSSARCTWSCPKPRPPPCRNG